ncbi:hypothetical protein [Bordetella bronchiseptica]|uniref:hypothetical protein n=1 Tax=Bordetella bronchiseptica TaxID=518 RepID=UPI00211EF2BD|nr:hypothetical protein [Bordetella bronchiseptica]
MTTENNATQAVQQDPLSDEYVNAVIQRHGYDSPETVIASLAQWIGRHGGENSVTLLMYEAHKALSALSKLRAPVADERALHIKALQDLRLGVEMDQHYMDDGDAKLAALDAAITALRWSAGALQALNIEADKITLDGETRTVGDILDHADRALASAPVAGEARPTDRQEALRITELPDVDEALATFCSDGTQDNAVGLVLAILGSSPQASPVSEEAVYTLRVRGAIQAWTPTVAAFSIPDGEHQLFLSPAAPQASAEAWQALAATMYQAAGSYNMPVRILDALSAAANGEPFAHMVEGMLPVEPPFSPDWVSFREGVANGRAEALEVAAKLMDNAADASAKHSAFSDFEAAYQGAAESIRALKSTPAPTAAEGGEDDMLTIAYLAGAQAEKERAGDVVEALRPFAALEESDLIGTTFQGKGDEEAVLYFHRTGKSITLGDFRRAHAALAARKEGDGNAN